MKAAIRLLLVLALVAPAMAFAQSTTTPTTPPPTCKIYAAATNVGYNTRVRIDWTTTNAQSGYLTEVGTIGPKGYAYVVPGKSTTYTASFTGKGGTAVCRTAIIVSSGSGATTGAVGGGGSPAVPAGQPGNNVPVTTATSPLDTNGSINANSINVGESVDVNGNPVTTMGSVSAGQVGSQNTPAGALPVAQNIVPTSGSGGGFLGGIVPQECRSGPPGTDPLNTVKNCDMCALGQMVQNIVNFGIGLTIPAAALLFAIAGGLYFSSRGSQTRIDQAHKIFRTVVIGFVLVISAFTLVNTVLNALIKGSDFRGWNWSTLDCKATRDARIKQTNKKIEDYLNSSLPNLTVYTPSITPSSTYGCRANEQYAPDSNECINTETNTTRQADKTKVLNCPPGYTTFLDSCSNADGDIVDPIPGSARAPVGGRRGIAQCPDDNPNCSVAYLESLGLTPTQAQTASCIAITENSGNAVGCSGTGPCGTFQISKTNWRQYAPPECSANNFSGNITAAQNNGPCNARTMATMVQAQGWQPWTGSNPGQSPWNPAARNCVGNYDPANLR